MRSVRELSWSAACLLLFSCEPPRVGSPPAEPSGELVTTELPESVRAERERLLEGIAELEGLTAAELEVDRAVPHETLTYDPLTAVNLGLIEGSSFAPDEIERARLARDGFVITERMRFPTFAYGYQTIYMEDLPVYISADAILEAVHRSYDDILKTTEQWTLLPELVSLLGSMREALGAGAIASPTTAADVDLYLAVALSLLGEEPASCVAGCSDADVARFVAAANAHQGTETVILFGSERLEDFSQYGPRGHYEGEPDLERYFRAMMWLGRIDLRILETQPDHSQIFRRQQLLVALGLRALMDEEALARWQRIDAVITAFVGEHDYMILAELDALLSDLDVASASELESLDDRTIAQAIVDGGYGTQRISSHVMINGLRQGTMPLSASFAFLGQRYVVDSHVFSNVVHDRVDGGGEYRMMPSTLDVAYAALGNDEAVRLLAPELAQYDYAPDLEAMRLLVDAHGEEYWRQDLYTTWLGSLRALSPHAGAPDTGLPAIARTEPWGRRILSTQLASWAELRHDTILYAKQSYTSGSSCEFPDAYVEPYPAFFRALAELARRGQAAMALTGTAGDGTLVYFQRLEEIAMMLTDMAEHQRTGTPFSEAQMAFVNQAIMIQEICGAATLQSGWLAELSWDRSHAVQLDPTIADVHTQPTDEAGNFVGRVLHVATGMPRAATFTFETCEGPRAYVGLVSSYFEEITENFERRTDSEWSERLEAEGHPADPAFLGDLVVR